MKTAKIKYLTENFLILVIYNSFTNTIHVQTSYFIENMTGSECLSRILCYTVRIKLNSS